MCIDKYFTPPMFLSIEHTTMSVYFTDTHYLLHSTPSTTTRHVPYVTKWCMYILLLRYGCYTVHYVHKMERDATNIIIQVCQYM